MTDIDARLFRIDAPERMLIVQLDGSIRAWDWASDFNKLWKPKYASNRVRGVEDFDRLAFTARPGMPHLQPDGDTLDVSTGGLLTLLCVYGKRHGGGQFDLPRDLRAFFEQGRFASLHRAEDWFDRVYPRIVFDRSIPVDDWRTRSDLERELASPTGRAFWTEIKAMHQ